MDTNELFGTQGALYVKDYVYAVLYVCSTYDESKVSTRLAASWHSTKLTLYLAVKPELEKTPEAPQSPVRLLPQTLQ